MQHVYCKISIPLLDEMPGFWKKLRAFVGEFRIEPHSIDEWVRNSEITISFYTDKVLFAEGERRMVVLEAKTENDSWDFSDIKK